MNLELVEKIAEAVLYEGYMLYPYRASAVKNQQRWNIGVLCPRDYSEAQNGSQSWAMQTECLLQADPSTQLHIKIRFLQIVNRSIGSLTQPLHDLPKHQEPEFQLVERLKAGGRTYSSWQEAVEHEIIVPRPPAAFSRAQSVLFEFGSGREFEPIIDENGWIVGIILREWKTLSGSVEINLNDCGYSVVKITARICNLSRGESPQPQTRSDSLMSSLVSTHTILAAEGGRFISLIDPPENLRPLARECSNIGTWPVLVGEEGKQNTMLSSPIILYDYPQIAQESPGNLFDGTEIDEILSLRILTMTDEEKNEMRQSDDRTRQILERTENMPPEQFMKLHGALRNLQPAASAQETP